ncbi:MAG: hypothetical protein KAR64_09010 [Thermoplasmatales archaeon]|nr:hypothetical protein [Thermoplasmatales archaeon]
MNEFDEWLDYTVSVNENIRLLYYEMKFALWDIPPKNSTSEKLKHT